MGIIDEEVLKNSSRKFRVNEAARFLDVTPRILKYYEKTGVLAPERTDGNDYRAYTAEDIIKVQVAEHLKDTGFTTGETAAYFSGDMDVAAALNKLADMRKKIDALTEILSADMNPDIPRFSVCGEITQLCYVGVYPRRKQLTERYFDARENYCNAIKAGCKCDKAGMFFFLPVPGDKRKYRICLPVSAAPEGCAGAEYVTRRRSFAARMAGRADAMDRLRALLKEEADRRGLKLSDVMWSMSETGPNRKTSGRRYSLVVGVELE